MAFDDHLIIFVQVAILDGITMGAGGAGIAMPAMFRVVTDKTVCIFCLLYKQVPLDFIVLVLVFVLKADFFSYNHMK